MQYVAPRTPANKGPLNTSTPVAPVSPVSNAAPMVVVQQQQMQAGAGGFGPRPLGVTVISILTFLGVAALVAWGIFWVFAAVIGATAVNTFWQGAPSWLLSIIGLIGAIAALFCFGVAALFFLVGMGNLRGSGWSWTLILVLSLLWGILMVLGLFGADADGLVYVVGELAVAGLIIWYYYTPDVKRYFGKTQMRAAWQRRSA